MTGTYSSIFIAAAIVSFWRGSTARAAAHAPASAASTTPQQPGRSKQNKKRAS
jgi:hypothetical protein